VTIAPNPASPRSGRSRHRDPFFATLAEAGLGGTATVRVPTRPERAEESSRRGLALVNQYLEKCSRAA
jgi:hypothetical protein